MYCPNCGKEIPEGAKFCPDCGHGAGASGDVSASAALMFNKKSEGLALILSLLIPGLGHIYVGQTNRGVMILIGFIVCAILGAFLFVPWIGNLVLWIYGMYDSYKLTDEYNRYLLEHNGQPPW